jgi:hypothetical protein
MILQNAESEQVIKGPDDTEIGRMVVTAANDMTTASNKSANGRLISMRVCTMTTNVQ